MIENLRYTLFDFDQTYQNPVDRQRAVGLMAMSVFIGLIWLAILILGVLVPGLNGLPVEGRDMAVVVILPVVLAAIHQLLRGGRIKGASWVFVLTLLLGITLPTVMRTLDDSSIILLLVIVTGASVLMNRDELFIVYLLTGVTVLVGAYNQTQAGTDPVALVVFSEPALIDAAVILFTLTVWLVFQLIFSTAIGQIVDSFVQTRNRLALLNRLPERLRAAQNEEDVIVRALGFVTEDMGLFFGQLYLFDEQGRLSRYARIGMGTRLSIVPADELQTQPNSAITRALRGKIPYRVSLGDMPQRRSHFLPEATSGVVVPLLYGDETFGVLDIQSNKSVSPFTDDELNVLGLLAVRVATALLHAREVSRLSRDLSEQRTLNTHLRSQLEGYQNQPRQRAGGDWLQYVEGRAQQVFGYDLKGDTMQVIAAHDIPAELRPALAAGDVVVHENGHQQVINVPVMFRNEILGAMAFTLPPYQQANERQINMAQVVAQRLALALENVRLVEQSRDQAQRERRASELTNQLISQQDVDVVLELAAENFREALGAVYTHIYLEPVQATGEEAR